MSIMDELDSVYDGFCNSDHKITYVLMCVLFPAVVVVRFVLFGLFSVFRGGRNKAVMLHKDGRYVVESWYYGRFTFDTKEKADSFCNNNHLKVKIK